MDRPHTHTLADHVSATIISTSAFIIGYLQIMWGLMTFPMVVVLVLVTMIGAPLRKARITSAVFVVLWAMLTLVEAVVASSVGAMTACILVLVATTLAITMDIEMIQVRDAVHS